MTLRLERPAPGCSVERRADLVGPGGNNVTITLDWDDNNNSHQWPPGRTAAATVRVQRDAGGPPTFVGTHSDQFPPAAQSGPIALVRTSRPRARHTPGARLHAPGPRS